MCAEIVRGKCALRLCAANVRGNCARKSCAANVRGKSLHLKNMYMHLPHTLSTHNFRTHFRAQFAAHTLHAQFPHTFLRTLAAHNFRTHFRAQFAVHTCRAHLPRTISAQKKLQFKNSTKKPHAAGALPRRCRRPPRARLPRRATAASAPACALPACAPDLFQRFDHGNHGRRRLGIQPRPF